MAQRKCSNPSCTTVMDRDKYRYCKSCRANGLVAATNGASAAQGVKSVQTLLEAGDIREITKQVSVEVRTLEDLIRVCEIDTTAWEIAEWRCVVHEMGSVPRAIGESKQWARPSTEPVVTPLFSVSAKLRRKTKQILTLERLSKELLEDIRVQMAGYKFGLPVYKHVDENWLFEFPPFDLHLGKLTWDDETVTNYDINIAADLFNASLDFLLDLATKQTDGGLSRILCVFGNDVSHIDGKRGETTAGTHMDVDTRYIKIYRRICEIHRRAVSILRDVAPVDIVIVPGNHDELTCFHLGEILSAVFEKDPYVTVDNNPKLRKYYEYGTNLFGFAHGDVERVSELPLVMAREVPDAWARCQSREWHIGHKHISEKYEAKARFEQDFTSDKGVRVRRLTSLSAHDAWHTKHAYMDRRACEGFIFHKDAGFTSHLSFNVDHFTGRALSV